jgi:hypothetical protein
MTALPEPLSRWVDTAPAPDRTGVPLPGSVDVAVPAFGAVRVAGQAHPRRWLLGLADQVERAGGEVVPAVRPLRRGPA